MHKGAEIKFICIMHLSSLISYLVGVNIANVLHRPCHSWHQHRRRRRCRQQCDDPMSRLFSCFPRNRRENRQPTMRYETKYWIRQIKVVRTTISALNRTHAKGWGGQGRKTGGFVMAIEWPKCDTQEKIRPKLRYVQQTWVSTSQSALSSSNWHYARICRFPVYNRAVTTVKVDWLL